MKHNIDADPEFQATLVPENGSAAVATAAALIDRRAEPTWLDPP
jgi:hypothetical protein